ncbi:hypothetical protein [Qipengyuania sp. DGS5-3]|uniref:hypothetical protein n=1 Tax=Qipengyuania sp. DGS5-3 TaxID=3349632 RepID=UPI0036D331FF
MTRIVELTSTLDCTADEAWHHVGSSALLHHITHPLIRFVPTKATPFPERWTEGEYRAWMLLFGVIPIGWQAIRISFPDTDERGTSTENTRYLRDNGYGPLIKRWDHWIEIAPEVDKTSGEKTRYTDRVYIEAGLLTPLIAAFARIFYGHRQRRWCTLASDNFSAIS